MDTAGHACVVAAVGRALGVGGGAICVPALSILFGASDLIARGTSLLSMFPNAMTTTVANVRRKMVHAKAGLIIGIVAALTAPLGTWIAGAMSPRAGGILDAGISVHLHNVDVAPQGAGLGSVDVAGFVHVLNHTEFDTVALALYVLDLRDGFRSAAHGRTCLQ